LKYLINEEKKRLCWFFFASGNFDIMGNITSSIRKKDPTILADEDLKLLKTNTQYSEEEIQAWHAGFLKDCPTGRLDKKQFLSVYRVCIELISIKY
jgi:hypothetical protein